MQDTEQKATTEYIEAVIALQHFEGKIIFNISKGHGLVNLKYMISGQRQRDEKIKN